jgi:Uma2 family endonuclease
MTTTAATLLTAEEFRLLPDNGRPVELVKGVVVEMSLPTPRHGEICVNVSYLLRRFLEDNPLGRVVSNDAAVITHRGPDTVRGPDVAFYSYQRVPRGPLPIGYIDVPPELAVEVRSRSDRWPTIQLKVGEYLNTGVALVCVLDEETATAHVFPIDRPPRAVAADGDLDLSDVLPGFRVPLRRFFE